MSKLQYACRQHSSLVLVAFALLVILVFGLVAMLELDHSIGTSKNSRGGFFLRRREDSAAASLQNAITHWGGAVRPGYFFAEDAILSPTQFRFAAVTDLDELSRVPGSKKPEFFSIFLGGVLSKEVNKSSNSNNAWYKFTLEDSNTRRLVTKHNEAGRGAEFSELTIYNGRLLTFDDRTGDVFEILNNEDGTDSFVVPRYVITEGNGETDKGMKWEWSTVKDGELYMGSMGKEYTRSDGSVKNRNNLWVGVLNDRGELRREDWTDKYLVMRQALGAAMPGYMIIEAANWSPILKKWVFLPRRISPNAYDENIDEQMGGHMLVLLDEDFTNPVVVDIKLNSLDPLKGFSTFAFIPNSDDRHVLAIRSVEENCVDFTAKCEQRTYFIVFDVTTGEQLSEELEYKDKVKFEGVEFVDMYAKPPA
jgi:soluble calcium-activated nucleotidase 1